MHNAMALCQGMAGSLHWQMQGGVRMEIFFVLPLRGNRGLKKAVFLQSEAPDSGSSRSEWSYCDSTSVPKILLMFQFTGRSWY